MHYICPRENYDLFFFCVISLLESYPLTFDINLKKMKLKRGKKNRKEDNSFHDLFNS